MLHPRGGAPPKALQPTVRVPWSNCGPRVTHTKVRTPLRGYSPWMITTRTETFPKRLRLTENTYQGRNSPNGPVTHAETTLEQRKTSNKQRSAERKHYASNPNPSSPNRGYFACDTAQLVPCGILPAQDALRRFSEGRDSRSLQMRHIHMRGMWEVDPPPALPAHPDIMNLSRPWH